jgi:hypothetical protein
VVYAPKIGISNAENIDLVEFFSSKLN